MKGKTLSAIGLIAALAGVAIILFHSQVSKSGIILTGGVLFVAAGVLNLIVYGQSKEGQGFGRLLSQLANAAAIVLGICLLVFKSTFEPMVAFIFGLLIAVCALWQFFLLAIGARPHQLPGWLYAFPLALTAAAIYIFLQKDMAEPLLLIITGASLAVVGVGCVIEGACLGVARRAAEKESEKVPEKAPEREIEKGAEKEQPKEAEKPEKGESDAEKGHSTPEKQ